MMTMCFIGIKVSYCFKNVMINEPNEIRFCVSKKELIIWNITAVNAKKMLDICFTLKSEIRQLFTKIKDISVIFFPF